MTVYITPRLSLWKYLLLRIKQVTHTLYIYFGRSEIASSIHNDPYLLMKLRYLYS